MNDSIRITSETKATLPGRFTVADLKRVLDAGDPDDRVAITHTPGNQRESSVTTITIYHRV